MLKEQEKNEINSLNNGEESSIEHISGEEEDEDDLLKSESETNKSSNKNININKEINSSKNIEILASQNKNIDDNIKEKTNNNIFEASIRSSNNSYLRKSEEPINRDRRRRASGPPELKKDKEEKNDETELDDEDKLEEDEEDIEMEDSQESILNLRAMYEDSDISYKSILDKIKKGFYVYGIKSKIYYIFLTQPPFNKNKYLFIKSQPNEEEKINSYNNIINSIISQKYDKSKIKENLYKFFREKVKDGEIILIDRKNMNEYTFNRKLKVYYMNYLDKKATFEISFNINWRLFDFLDYIKHLYHIPDIRNNINISIITKNKKYSAKELSKFKDDFFSPKNFNYEKDYILFLEHENYDIITLDLGSSFDKYNFKGRQIPHIIFSSHNNLCVESILVSKQLKSFECEIYVFRDEYYYNLESNIGKNNYEKAKDVLLSPSWKNKCNYITTIKTMKNSDYKNNEDVLSFSIWPKFVLKHDKTYVFLVSTPIININVFDSGAGDQGLFIISGDNRAIINGIICKKLSDFCI